MWLSLASQRCVTIFFTSLLISNVINISDKLSLELQRNVLLENMILIRRNVLQAREVSIYDVKLMFAPRSRRIRRVFRERSNEGVLFTLIAL